ncbi:uncharacterized protein LOC129301879 isoform X2 [Prosopis cineraria]|uniref:uncharacterized protein LOC129301879 isoform X2 n=1 Tax=Prosopis cineraria TaxID=364024 RepID=UPI00240FE80A|nr:uncharacterized protein LOC129301879 isoform X2 [Prosopis cineraria]
MVSRSRGRTRKNNAPGNRRIDAALDAMLPYGFNERLVRETVNELLDVYEGTQGWPFIEEHSYELLIETILSKQQISSEEKDDIAIGEGETVTSVDVPTRVNSEAGSSNLVAEGVAPQTNDAQVSASLDVEDSTQFRLGAENERKSVDDAIRSNRNSGAKNVKLPVTQPSQPCEDAPIKRRKPCYGWIGSDADDENDLIHLPVPPLPEELMKLLQQNAAPKSGKRGRRKSRSFLYKTWSVHVRRLISTIFL